MTLLFCSTYGIQRSTITGCGLGGIGAKRSTITLRGGAGNFLPGIVTTCCGTHGGGHGGTSRITNGSGVHGRGGCWRMISGGAGAVGLFGSCLIIISPGACGVGGFKYLMAISWLYSTFLHDFFFIKSGQQSWFIGYSPIGKSPFHVHTSHLFAQIPRWPRTFISSVSIFIFINNKKVFSF